MMISDRLDVWRHRFFLMSDKKGATPRTFSADKPLVAIPSEILWRQCVLATASLAKVLKQLWLRMGFMDLWHHWKCRPVMRTVPFIREHAMLILTPRKAKRIWDAESGWSSSKISCGRCVRAPHRVILLQIDWVVAGVDFAQTGLKRLPMLPPTHRMTSV